MQKATSFWDSQANQIIDWNSMLLKVYEQLEKRQPFCIHLLSSEL